MPGRGLLKALPARGYYPADVVVLAYLGVVSALLLASPRGIPGQGALAAVHLGLLAVVALLRFAPRECRGVADFLRHFYPAMLLPLAYSDLGHLTRLLTGSYFDAQVVQLDQAIFGCQISQVLHTLVPSRFLSEYTHLSYLLYFALVPLVSLPLYGAGRRAELRLVTTTFMATFAACYLTFIAFPVQGPFHHFGPLDPQALQSYFAGLSHWVLHRGSALGTAFPSSHVAAAVVAWMMCRRTLPRLAPWVLVLSVGVFIGTVYGGFHYGADALAGLLAGIVLAQLGPRLHTALLGALGMAAPGVPVQAPPRLPQHRPGRERLSAPEQPASPAAKEGLASRQTDLVPAHMDEEKVAVQTGCGEAASRTKAGGAVR